MTRVVAAIAVVGVGFFGSVGPAAAATPAAPYTDPSADGYLGICNQQGQQITSGNINTVPFAWKVVSSVAAPSSVGGKGRTATLYAYQPIEGLAAGSWSGEQITGTSQYSNPSAPMAASTDRDFALSQFLNVFPPKWDGFIQLRVFLDAPGVEPSVLSYPALSLYISGDTWQAVGGGSVDCNAGQAKSEEAILPTSSTGGSGTQSATSSSAGGAPARGGSSSSPGTDAKRNDSAGPRGSSTSDGSSSGGATVAAASNSSNTAPLAGLIAAAVILAAIAAWLVIRSRRQRSPS